MIQVCDPIVPIPDPTSGLHDTRFVIECLHHRAEQQGSLLPTLHLGPLHEDAAQRHSKTFTSSGHGHSIGWKERGQAKSLIRQDSSAGRHD